MQRDIKFCDLEHKNEETEEDFDADVLDDIVEYIKIQEDGEEENKESRIFEDDKNTKDEHKANEVGDEFHSVSTFLELIIFQENYRNSNYHYFVNMRLQKVSK